MTPPADPERYKNHRFPGEIISHGVWLYYRFTLSYRDVQELLFERGIDVTHEGRAPRQRNGLPDVGHGDRCGRTDHRGDSPPEPCQ